MRTYFVPSDLRFSREFNQPIFASPIWRSRVVRIIIAIRS
jgi:hypothetical protein